MAASTGNHTENNDETKPGPANPQGSGHLDSPTPPGGPLRSDSPSGSTVPGGPSSPAQPGEPENQRRPMRPVEEPIGEEAEPATLPTGEDVPDSSQDLPSDDAGSH